MIESTVATALQGLIKCNCLGRWFGERLRLGKYLYDDRREKEDPLWLIEPVASPSIPREIVLIVRMCKARQGSSTASHPAMTMDESNCRIG